MAKPPPKDADFAHLLRSKPKGPYVPQSGLPIKLMTLGLLGITAYYGYILNERGVYPWQHGHKLSDLVKR